MKTMTIAAILVAASGPAWAGDNHLPAPSPQANAAAVGVGISNAQSTSTSQAVAISGQGGAGGQGGKGGKGGTGIGVGTGGNVTIAGAPANTTQTITTQGKTSVSTVPSVFAPGLAAAGIESCLGSVSGGGSWLGTGVTLGGSIPDKDCSARLDARTLWSFGLKKAAVARLCQTYDIRASMPDVCAQYLPVATVAPAAYAAPASAPLSVYASVEPTKPGQIMLIEGKTGRERLCNDYDEPRQKCRLWDGQTKVLVAHHSAPKKVAKTAPAPAAAENPTVAQAPVTETKKD